MNNNKKYFVVFGIFALVIVTTAASFAFFTYSRVGNTTTTITSGDIEFSYIEGEDASLANAFPVSDSVGAGDTTEEYTFDVKMKSSSSSNKMEYNVYLLDNNKEENVNYFTNEQIKFALIKDNTFVAGTSADTGKKLTDISGFATGERHGEGIVLEDQEIIAGKTDKYKLRIWISDDVNYSNTEETDDGTDVNNDSQTSTGKYNGYKYSLKVKVTSGMSNSIGINLNSEGRTVTADLEDINGLASYAVTKSNSTPNESEWIEITDGIAKNNVIRTANDKITSKSITYKVDNYGTYYLHVKNKLNQVKSKMINVSVKEITKDTSGAATPVIKGDLVPVIMNGSDVIKADASKGWYNYDESIWANAVILTDNAPIYNNGDMIKEEHIESYFVWIPRYRYKIFDEGKYSALGSKENAEQPIEIEFETNDVEKSTGSTYGTWLTHPAFTTFDDNNGFWVGKFETGHKGATSPEDAEQNVTDTSKLIIKPNVYSWRGILLGNMFKVSYDYRRDLDSHMIKNTEWGAIAYLSHSKYGNLGETGNGVSLRLNNNSAHITGYSAVEEPTKGYNDAISVDGNRIESTALGTDGKYTINFLNPLSVVSSTTGNYSGVYDMSGGTWEYVMGYTTNSSIGVGGTSEITKTYPTFFTSDEYTKYYDKYTSTSNKDYYNRILGDATGELGPFYGGLNIRYYNSSWYDDYAIFILSSSPWFARGACYEDGFVSGLFGFGNGPGINHSASAFRVVLTP